MLVSVSITTYDHERYIAQAIEGVLAQRGDFELELVIGDDCSTDRTREIVAGYQLRHPGIIRTVLPERQLGQGGKQVFAETLRLCRGSYVAVLDGDDYWTSPEKLARQVSFLEAHPECSMCFHDVLAVYEDGERKPERFNRPDQPRFTGMAEVLRSCFIASCSPAFRRAVLAELPAWYFSVPWGDWPLYVIAAEHGRIGYLDEVLGVYRVHGGGMWSGIGQIRQVEGVLACYRALDPALGHRYRRLIRRLASKCRFDLAVLYGRQGDLGRATRHALGCLTARPSGERSRAWLLRALLRSHLGAFRGKAVGGAFGGAGEADF